MSSQVDSTPQSPAPVSGPPAAPGRDQQCHERVVRVTMQEIAVQRGLGWPDFHPEDYCHRCGRGNISWSIDSDRFNTAMGGLPDGHAWNGIICIQCFVELHEAATGLRCSWTLAPGTPFRPTSDEHLEVVT